MCSILTNENNQHSKFSPIPAQFKITILRILSQKRSHGPWRDFLRNRALQKRNKTIASLRAIVREARREVDDAAE